MSMSPSAQPVDATLEPAVREFVKRVSLQLPVRKAFLFGSRARGTHQARSDADVAIVLGGVPGRRVDEALRMADIAFDVMLETDVLVEAIPLWESEWEHPESFSNPALVENIRRDGVPV